MDLATLYRDIAETSPDGIWVIDLEGSTIYANKTLARMYGVSHAEVGSLTVFDTLDAVGKAQFAEHLLKVRGGEHEQEVEALFHNQAGTATWILVRESLLRDDDGQVTAIVHRVSDFDARRRLNDELVESRSQLQEAQRIAQLRSWMWSPQSGELHVTGEPTVPPLLGPVSARTFEDFLDQVHPRDHDRVRNALSTALGSGDHIAFDVRVPGVGELQWAWVRVRGVVTRDGDGRVSALTGTHQDVTAIKATEQALRLQIEQNLALHQAAIAANEASDLVGAMQATCAIARDQLLGEQVCGYIVRGGRAVLVSGDETSTHAGLAARAIASGDHIWAEDGHGMAAAVASEGLVHAVITYLQPSPLRRNLAERAAGIVARQLMQVAERDVARAALALARDEATAALRQKNEFLTTMSHEIRTPLNAIIGLNDLLSATALASDQQRLTTGVHAAGRALLQIINDVLDFSAIQTDGVSLQRVDFEVRQLLDGVIRGLSQAAREVGVELILTCDEDVPTSLTGDPTRLAQVLVSLASNAIKFSQPGEVLVSVSATPDGATVARTESRDAAAQTRLRIEVRDIGIGVDPDQLENLFDPFWQADASSTRRFGGTGLGLAIAKEIVASLGGELGYEPNPGGGSLFHFTAAFEVPVIATGPHDEYARTWLNGRRILVADNRADRRALIEERATLWTMRVSSVPDRPTALAALHQSVKDDDPYEGIVIGFDSDDVEGIGLARDVAQETALDAVAMILLTSSNAVDMAQVRAAGVSVCLARPVLASDLRGTLLEQLAGVAATPMEAARGRVRGPRRSVLVVEDNPVNQLVATGLLESMGYIVGLAEDGQAAIDLLAVTAYDAVLMDVQMPVLDGYSATRLLRERGVRLPIIAVTAAAVAGERERCLDAGMDDFLTKPIDSDALEECLVRWLGVVDRIIGDDPAPVLPPTPPMVGLDTVRLDMLRDLDPGDTTYLDRAIANFRVNSAEAVRSIGEHLADGDLPAVRAIAHKIAGSALNLGVPVAGDAARTVELASGLESHADLPVMVAALDDAMTTACARLLAYQETYAADPGED